MRTNSTHKFMVGIGALALSVSALALSTQAASAEACMKITLTGTQGGPPVFKGLAGAGTLVQYGDDADQCGAVRLQFDAGRGTTQRLSEIGVPVASLNAVFMTHMHSDHTEGLTELMQLRWHFNSEGPKIDFVVADDAKSPRGHTLSGRNFASHIGDTLIQSGEMAQRLVENPKRLPGGPADLIEVKTFPKAAEPTVVWSSGDVKVSAISSTHIPGHASYRVDTPAGSVVIGGDAGNDTPKPPRSSSTSAQVEKLAAGADAIVHSTIHPVMGPDKESGFPPPIYFRQSTATDLGAMAKRTGAKHLLLTHLIPPLGAARQGPYPIPGGALNEASYKDAVDESGFEGETIVGTDLATLQLPVK
ncbi:MBL fold metallo-hydrolase [Rhizobiaceae bacterium]|nr:MBL fold metallo-hydrolase [Rhizobiaceae bacterium]